MIRLPNIVSANRLLEQWRKGRAGLTRSQYQAEHPYAFLVWAPHMGAQPTPVAPAQLAFHTQIHTLGAHRPRPSDPSDPSGIDEVVVLPLIKAPNNPFPDRISLGRAPNCDLVIRAPSVSKLHGHFREVNTDSAVFTDARSANGTRIDGALISPGISVTIHKFCHIVFGRVRLQLLSASEVYDWLDLAG